MVPPVLLALGTHMVASRVVKDYLAHLGEIATWLPVVLAVAAYFVGNKIQQAQQSKATGGIIGQKAPDFEVELRTSDGNSEKKTLSKIIEESPLPTVVDFYQNF